MKPPKINLNPSLQLFKTNPLANPLLTLSHTSRNLPLAPQRAPKSPKPQPRQQTQPNRQALLRLNRPRDTAAGQNHAGEQRQLDAVGLALRDAVAAEGVQGADGAAGGDGGDAAHADVAEGAAAGGEGGEEVGGVG